MAINLNDNIYVSGQKHVDGKRLRADDTPWTSTSEVLSTILIGNRAESQEFYVVDRLYWFKGGVEPDNLVEKLEGGTGELITKFTSNPTYTIVDDKIVIPAGETWLIDSVPYTNPSIIEIPFDYAITGYLYFLSIVATKFNTFVGKVGIQSTVSPSEPTINSNELLFTTFLISDLTLDVITPPVTSDIYVEKATLNPFLFIGTGEIGTVGMDKRSAISILGTVTKVGNISKNNPNDFIIGQPFVTNNKTLGIVEFPHMYLVGGSDVIPFFNPEGASYFAKINESTIWIADIIDGQKVYRRATSSLQNESVTLEKLAKMPGKTFIGNAGNAEAIPQHIDKLDALEMLGLENASSKIAAIEAILASDDINLDTLQEIVDAIKDIDTYLSTILVNDLTTGGTTKALTAEMGKTLKTSLDALTLVVNGKQDTLTDTNFGAFTNSVATKNTQVDTDVLAYVDVTTGKWVKQTFSKLIDYLKGYFQTSRIIVTSNITAVNGSIYHNVGNNIFTDPTPETNRGYYVLNIAGSPTIGGSAISAGTYLKRYHDGTNWITNIIKKGISNFVYSANKTLNVTDHQDTFFMDAGILTVAPASNAYVNGHASAIGFTASSNTSIVLQADTGWTYVINANAPIASGSVFGEKGGTATIVRKANLKIFQLNGSII